MNNLEDPSDWNESRFFVSVIQSGSFSEAARQLHLPKSTLSKKVSDLERRLGIRLLNRTTRRLDLTGPGQLYFDRALRLVTALRDLDREVQDLGGTPSGLLRISLPTTLLASIGPALASYLKLYPEVFLEVNESQRAVDLEKERFDLALRGTNSPPVDTDGCLLYRGAQVVVAHPGVSPVKVEDLSELTAVSTYPARDWVLTRGAQIHRFRPQVRFFADTTRSLLSAAENGVGMAMLPELACRKELAEGRLVRLAPGWVGETGMIWALYPKERWLTAGARALLTVLKEYFQTIQGT